MTACEMTADPKSAKSWFWQLATVAVVIGVPLYWWKVDSFQPLFLAVFTNVGFGVLIFAIHRFVWEVRLSRRATATDGVVVGIEEQDSGEGTTFHTKVEFETRDCAKHVFTSDFGTGWRGHQLGQVVRVLFDPERPQNAIIETQLYVGPLLFGFVGAFFAGIGFVMLLSLENQ